MGKAILGAFLAAVGMFLWGWVVWGPILDLYEVESFEKTTEIVEAIKTGGDETGVYWIPAMPEDYDAESEAGKAFEEKYREGPRALVIYRSDGGEVMDFVAMAKGFGLQVVACLLAAFLILGAGVRTFFGRWIFCATIGLILSVYSDGMNWAFFHYPDPWTLTAVIDHVGAWVVAGLLLAMIVRPK